MCANLDGEYFVLNYLAHENCARKVLLAIRGVKAVLSVKYDESGKTLLSVSFKNNAWGDMARQAISSHHREISDAIRKELLMLQGLPTKS